MTEKTNVYEVLSKVDVTKFTQQIKTKSGDLTYLPWSDAWALLLSYYPDSTQRTVLYPSVEQQHIMLPYLETGTGFYVTVEVTVEGQTRQETLPVMSASNRRLDKPDNTDINKATKRCLTKAIASHGLGLYIYQGEDVPVGQPKFSGEEEEFWLNALENDYLAFAAMAYYEPDKFNDIAEPHIERARENQKVTSFKKRMRDAQTAGHSQATDVANAMVSHLIERNESGIVEEWVTLDDNSKQLVWHHIPDECKTEINQILRNQ